MAIVQTEETGAADLAITEITKRRNKTIVLFILFCIWGVGGCGSCGENDRWEGLVLIHQ